ncbi:MAG: hypothetical protein QOG35_3094 [Solirubrobacteraceae bacterium]|jgi:hypothetical protein|nr:hypothetical protein [Solirubrobacteraceae bacterium]
MHEAAIEETEHGRRPAGDGWFVLNVGGSPREAYADRPPIVPARSPWPLG